MPAIAHKSDYGLWLDKDARKHEPLKGLLQSYYAGEMMSCHPVSMLVNGPRSQGSELIAGLEIISA